MPELTRRLSPDAREECWQTFYGDVRVGTITKRVGTPNDKPRWGWSCGFIPAVIPVNAPMARRQPSIRLERISRPLMTCPCGQVFDSQRLEETVVHVPHITASVSRVH
jgi:hypothetical protein